MIMLPCIVDFENYGDLWIEALNVVRGKICAGIKDQSINARGKRGLASQEIGNSAISVCDSSAEGCPLTRNLYFKGHGDARRRTAAGSIKHVCGDATH